jgi:hypothetical protein
MYFLQSHSTSTERKKEVEEDERWGEWDKRTSVS